MKFDFAMENGFEKLPMHAPEMCPKLNFTIML